MKAKQIISLIVGITSVAFSPIAWAAGHAGGGGSAGSSGHFGGAVSTAVDSVVSNTLQEELVLAEVESVLAECAEADFAQPRIGMGALILPVEVSADQPVHSDTTTEAAARLLLGHTNSADGETNR